MLSLVGISLHCDAVRFVKVVSLKGRQTIDDLGEASLPAGVFSDGKLHDIQGLVDVLRELVKRERLKDCDAAIALSVSQVIHQAILVEAHLDDMEQEIEISENLSRYLPGVEVALNYDYVRVHPAGSDVLLVAARAQQMNEYVAAIQQCGMKVKAVDVDVYALARAVILLGIACQTTAVIDFDLSSACFIVLQKGKVIFYHHFIFSTADMDQILHQLLQLISQVSHIEKILLSGNVLLSKEMLQRSTGILTEVVRQYDPLFLIAYGLAMRRNQYDRN